MLVNVVQGLVVQAVGQHTIDGVQGLLHAGLNLIPVIGPLLGKFLGLVV